MKNEKAHEERETNEGKADEERGKSMNNWKADGLYAMWQEKLRCYLLKNVQRPGNKLKLLQNCSK